jgi:hypothetical protein
MLPSDSGYNVLTRRAPRSPGSVVKRTPSRSRIVKARQSQGPSISNSPAATTRIAEA